MTLFEKSGEIGGQFRLARLIPGKEEFAETLRYYQVQLEKHGVELRLAASPEAEELLGFEEIVIACGVVPRDIELPGCDRALVARYPEVITGQRAIGKRVAIIGAGGIGFDMAAFLLHQPGRPQSIPEFMAAWGVDMNYQGEGGLLESTRPVPARTIHLLQRKSGKPGAGLGKTTGWIHRSLLKQHGVKMLSGVEYLEIVDQGLRLKHEGREQLLEVDNVVLCAGQLSELGPARRLEALGRTYHLIGGALKAGEIDAKRAIAEGTELADRL